MSAKPNKNMVIRANIVMICIVLIMAIVSTGSLVNIMVLKGEKYQNMASEQQLYDTLISAPRGDIFDRNMKTLATSSPAWTVYITPNGFKKISKSEAKEVRGVIADGLSGIMELDREEIYEKTQKSSYYVIVKKKIEKATADKVREFITDNKDLKLSNYIGLDTTTKRYYPNDTLASTVLGFVGDDNQGLA
ncbi:MAG: stage V sporulation protein D, partial [Clostridia bacterium]|nr:stage V sporulation protein D [Clostridia bacterium]